MKKFTLIIFLSFFSYISYSQCPPNSTERVSTISNNDGFLQTISSNFYTDEYVTISGILNTDEYEFKSTHSGTINDYLTITDESNVPLYYGMSPLTLNNINLSTIRVHIRANAACETDFFSHTLTIIDLTVEPTTCQKPEQSSVKISYMSDKRIDLTWSKPIYGATPSDYYWEIVPSGNAQGVGVIAYGTTGGATNFSSGDVLNPSTYYSIYLRSNCGGDGDSTFLGPLTPSSPTNSIPPPANDFCSGAITLIEQTSIPNAASATSTNGNLLGGAGTDVNAELCNGKTGNSRDDVWYKFVAKTTNVNITVQPNPVFDAVVTLYSGNCNSLLYLACSDLNNNGNEEINYSGLTIGQTYYIRTYFYGTIKPSSLNFGIKVWSTLAATDADNDGYVSSVDCNDNDPAINPETVWYLDADGDNYAISTITQCISPGAGYTISVLPLTDCNDSNPNINPNTVWYLDADGDNYAVSTITQCTNPGAGYTINVLPITDCDDSKASVNPNAIEICDGLDNDCDGDIDEGVTSTFYADIDNDGYGDPNSTLQACSAPMGYVSDNSDCDDSKFAVNPGQTEIEGNGLDDDCNPSTPDNPLGVEEFNLNNVKISPNPFNHSISIQIPLGNENGNFNIGIYDLNGREIFNRNILNSNNNITIDHLNALQQGIYFIKITKKEDGKSVVRELIKY